MQMFCIFNICKTYAYAESNVKIVLRKIYRIVQKRSGTARTIEKCPRTIPKMSSNVQERPGTSRNVQERPGTSRNVLERPGTSRNVQERSRTSLNFLDFPRTSRNVQEHSGTFPGAKWSCVSIVSHLKITNRFSAPF